MERVMKDILRDVRVILLTIFISISLIACGSGGGDSTTTPPDTTPPTVKSTSPTNGATGVAINTVITATFSENMNAQTINMITFTVKDAGNNPVSGTVTYTGSTATFTPLGNLSYNTDYTATISTGAKDISGNALTAEYVWSFTTESRWAVAQNGNIVEVAYKNSATDVPQYAAIDLNSGYFRMNFGPQSGWGTSVVLMPSFWTGGVLYQGAPITTSWINEGENLIVSFAGTISSLNVQGQLEILPPGQDSISAMVTVNVTGDVALDSRPGEAFKPVFLSSMHISSDIWDTQSAYIGSQYAEIPASGWIFESPITGNTFGLTGGSSSWKTNAPTVEVVFGQYIQVTGWVTSSTDPNDDNVGLWAATDSLLTSWQYKVTAQL